MMRQSIEEQQDIRALATELLQQGERCALAGQLPRAEALLAQVWTITEVECPDLASDTAWHIAWLLMQRGAYTEACVWLSRVVGPPFRQSPLWPATRQTMVQVCQTLAGAHPDPPPSAPQPPAVHYAPAQVSPTQLPLLKVINLGRFQIIRTEVTLPTCRAHKSIALFRYLLTQRYRVAHKETLMELFWPDSRPQDARNSLHAAVSALRRHIDLAYDSYLLFEDAHYLINPAAPVDDDCAAFQQLCDQGEQRWQAQELDQAQHDYLQALACYQGDYFVDSRDLTWAISVQEHLLTRYLTALDHLGQIFMQQQRFEQAVDCYERLLDRDEYREDVYCQLMRCYWLLDRRHEALRQYEQCAALLAHDLGLEPLPETQALYRAISEHVPAVSAI